MVDGSDWSIDIVAIVRKYSLQNAVEYNGSGQPGSVLGRILGERTDLRKNAKELKKLVETEVDAANKLASEEGIDAARKVLEESNPEALNRQKQIRRTGLKELPNAKKGEVVLRFAPNPNGPLTLAMLEELLSILSMLIYMTEK